MANVIVTPDIIAKGVIKHLENEMVLGNMVHTDFSTEFTKVGDTINIRRPVQFDAIRDNLDITGANKDIIEGLQTLKMDKTITIPFEIGAKDRTLSVEKIQERYIEPACIKLKDEIEVEIASIYKDIYSFSGTPGVTPANFLALGTPGAMMDYQAVPNPRIAVHNPMTGLALADSLKNVYVQDKAKTAFEEASIGRYAGFNNSASVHIPDHVNGLWAGAPLVNGGAQNVTYTSAKDSYSQTLITDGWTGGVAGLLKKGDVFTIAGVYMVKAVSKQTTDYLQTFVVKSDTDSDGGGGATLTISPPMITDGAYQTVSGVPADNAVITVVSGASGSKHSQSLLFHKNAFALVTRPIEIGSESFKTSTKSGNKVSISVSETTDFNTLKTKVRLDMLFGVACIDPRLARRLTS